MKVVPLENKGKSTQNPNKIINGHNWLNKYTSCRFKLTRCNDDVLSKELTCLFCSLSTTDKLNKPYKIIKINPKDKESSVIEVQNMVNYF